MERGERRQSSRLASGLGLGLAAWAFFIGSASGAAAQNDVSFDGGLTVQVGQSFLVPLSMDFADTTLGGAVDVVFDGAVLRFDQFTFSQSLSDDPNFRCPTEPTAGNPVPCISGPFVSFGSFSGLSGQTTIGQAQLTALAVGTSMVRPAENRAFSDNMGMALAVGYSGVMITVPEPGAAAAAAAAVLALAGLRRQRPKYAASLAASNTL